MSRSIDIPAGPSRRQFLAATVAVSLFGATFARAAPDPLSTASSITSRIPNVLLNRVVRAGARLVAVGERGIVVWSQDNGVSWQQARVPVSVTLTNVFFATDTLGWASGHGGVLLNTQDGGETWQRQLDGRVFAESALRRAQGTGSPEEPSPRQLSYAERLVGDGPDKPFLAIHFTDALHGMAVGAYGIAARTVDGGREWIPCLEMFDNPNGMHLYALTYIAGAWVVAGEQGYLARSHGSSGPFTRLDVPGSGSFFTLANIQPNGVLAAGLLGNACLLKTDMEQLSPCVLPGKVTVLSAVVLRGGLVALVEAGGNLLVSKDRGQTFVWSAIASKGPITSIVEAADGSIVAAGPNGLRRLSMDQLAEPNTALENVHASSGAAFRTYWAGAKP